jgi:hypothetical protein
LKWVADQWAARRKLEGESKAKFEEYGTLLASGFIAGEAITGILLATLFLTGVKSITHLFTGHDVFSFVDHWGGWISLAAFAVIAHILVRIPVDNATPAKK